MIAEIIVLSFDRRQATLCSAVFLTTGASEACKIYVVQAHLSHFFVFTGKPMQPKVKAVSFAVSLGCPYEGFAEQLLCHSTMSTHTVSPHCSGYLNNEKFVE